MMLSRCSICNNKTTTFSTGPTAEPSSLERSSLERISQGSGIFDSSVYNTNRHKIKHALSKAFK